MIKLQCNQYVINLTQYIYISNINWKVCNQITYTKENRKQF